MLYDLFRTMQAKLKRRAVQVPLGPEAGSNQVRATVDTQLRHPVVSTAKDGRRAGLSGSADTMMP
ncbi:hypothetical protein N9L68_03895 [bacterium]|nr:hypothetical protein [bacterium]